MLLIAVAVLVPPFYPGFIFGRNNAIVVPKSLKAKKRDHTQVNTTTTAAADPAANDNSAQESTGLESTTAQEKDNQESTSDEIQKWRGGRSIDLLCCCSLLLIFFFFFFTAHILYSFFVFYLVNSFSILLLCVLIVFSTLPFTCGLFGFWLLAFFFFFVQIQFSKVFSATTHCAHAVHHYLLSLSKSPPRLLNSLFTGLYFHTVLCT